MNIQHSILLLAASILLTLAACKSDPKPDTPTIPPKPKVDVPKFNADNAYNYIQKQVDFGPRFVNSPGHKACASWLAQELESLGAVVTKQPVDINAYNGKLLKAVNIVGAINPSAPKRVLLCAHWDTRHIADYDPDKSNHTKPILGADDGGSGVGVLLEIARVLKERPLKNIGVDIVLFDAEDYGQPQDGGGFAKQDHTWALGSQHWSRYKHKPGYRATFGILLDMVGAKGAKFTMDGTSMKYAPQLMKNVWNVAHEAGFGNFFSYQKTGELQDDHLYVNMIAKIPTIDIIHRKTNNSFGPHWHTMDDNMSVISKSSLRAAGQTVLAVVYAEDVGVF